MSTKKKHHPFVLVVLDGWGLRDEQEHNAIAEAETPFFDSLLERFPHSKLDASGNAVGLPHGQMGNSEVGHMTIGAGTQIDTDLVRVDKAIACGELEQNDAMRTVLTHVQEHGGTLHLKGLLSPGGVHSHSDHIYACLRAAKRAGVTNLALHLFLDGRDTAPESGADYLHELEQMLRQEGVGWIASVAGRFYAMDRDRHWDRVEQVENAIFSGSAKYTYTTELPSEVVRTFYEQEITDEYIPPLVFLDTRKEYPGVGVNDAFLFCNFRSDRARMLTQRFLEHTQGTNVCYSTLTEYDPQFQCQVLFPPKRPQTTLAAELSGAGLSQVHIAETEKYAHATYFLNGGRETPHEHERHILIESRKDVSTHDEAPEMRANEITDAALEEIGKGTDFLFMNYANADMVGHTANVPAIKVAIETVDRELKRLVTAVVAAGGTVFITADHGNAEQNSSPDTNAKHTSHTTNLVPAILTDTRYALKDGTLADITPTILSLLAIPVPACMTGTSLASQRPDKRT